MALHYASPGAGVRSLGSASRALAWVAVLALAAVFITLGRWQSGKAERVAQARAHLQSANALAALDLTTLDAERAQAQDWQDRRVVLRGVFEPEKTLYLDNRIENGQPGVHVLTPLRLAAGAQRVLINRGWVAWTRGQPLPQVVTPAQPVSVQGRASVPSGKRFLFISDAAEANTQLWTRLDMGRAQERLGAGLWPIVVLQEDPAGAASVDGLLRHWPAPQDREAMHRGYAFQWYAMTLALALFAGVAVGRARRRRLDESLK